MKKLLLYTFLFLAYTNSPLFAGNEECQTFLQLEANPDIVAVLPDESITFNVLENDLGEEIFIKQISKPPPCGNVEILDAAMGTVSYVPNENFDMKIMSFEYEIEDEEGNTVTAIVKLVEDDVEKDLIVVVEKDCSMSEENGLYILTVTIAKGTPPFLITGNIDVTLEDIGLVNKSIVDGIPYEINVIDGEENSLFVSGGEIGCTKLDKTLYFTDIDDIRDCTCNGNMVVNLKVLDNYDITNIHGFWYDESISNPIQLGDTIPYTASIEIFEVATECYYREVNFLGTFGITGNVSEFCNTPTPIQAIDDFAATVPNEPVTLNLLTNDTGTNLQINQIFMYPSCGEILDINPKMGEVVYLPDTDTECTVDSFVYEVVDDCGDFAEATVTIFIEQEDDFIVQVERDCCLVDYTGYYTLSVGVYGGEPPFTISGSINEVLEEFGEVEIEITDGQPYEITVVDATGAEFFEAGGEISCSIFGYRTYIEDVDDIIDCTCEGDMIITFEILEGVENGEHVYGTWTGENQEIQEIYVGDTIPSNANFEVSSVGFYIIGLLKDGECYGFAGDVSNYCSNESDCTKALPDLATTTPTEPITFNVLENDIGKGLSIKRISKPPFCGIVEILDSDEGILQYTPTESCPSNLISFDYQIEDEFGGLADGEVKVVINENEDENDLVVMIERDCCQIPSSWYTYTFPTNIIISEGTPPFTISGMVDTILNKKGILRLFHDDSYEVSVVDALGKEFFESGGESSCQYSCPKLKIDSDAVLEGEVVECLCDGSMIVHLDIFGNNEIIESIYGFWYSDLQAHPIEVGDTIPSNAYLEIFEIQTNIKQYALYAEEIDFLSIHSFDFCPTGLNTIEASKDTLSTSFNETITFNVLENDKGTDLKIKSILIPPNCGEIIEVNPTEGTFTYKPVENTSCSIDNFKYQIEESCGNLAEAYVVLIDETTAPELKVIVGRDCSPSEEMGTYLLEIEILEGVAPFTISGNIDRVLDDFGRVSYPITDGNPFEVNVVDADGNEFHKEGGEIACVHFCPYLPLNIDDIEQIANCLCDGKMVFNFEGIPFIHSHDTEEITGHWSVNQGDFQPIVLGDTIPTNAYFELSHWYIDGVCHTFRINENEGIIGSPSDFCPTPCIEANLDLTTTSPTEPITFNVLENDLGEGIFIKQIAKPPFCGIVEIIDAAMGILQYTPDNSCLSNPINFEYQIEDIDGNRAIGIVKVVIKDEGNDLAVAVERDCCAGDWLIDLYPLTVYIVDGVPPFTVSGTINQIMDSVGIMSYEISGYEPYEIAVQDAVGNEFFAEGGEIACDKLCSEIEVYTDYVVEEGFLDCLCNGSLIVSFTPLAKYEEIQSIYGFWYLDNQPHPIEWGDTIPNNAYFEIFEVQTDYANYLVSTEKEGFLGGNTSDFCPAPCIEAHTDITTTSPTESITFNVLENDLGEGIFIQKITTQPLCGQVEIVDAELGTLRYTPDKGCLLKIINFGYRIEDVEQNTANAIVKVVVNRSENELVAGVEIDCTHSEETGIYSLLVSVIEGTSPFNVTINNYSFIDSTGVFTFIVAEGNPFEISIVDATGKEFYEFGADAACHTFGPQARLHHIEQIGTCTCEGNLIVDFEKLDIGEEIIEGITGHWLDNDGNTIDIGMGDTIPPHRFFRISHIETDIWGYILLTKDILKSPQGFASDFCNPENYTLEAIDDAANTQPGDSTTINILQNDTGTELQINQILSSPSCGQIIDLNVEAGNILYVADVNTDCFIDNFIVQVIDNCGNLTESLVTIFIEQEVDLNVIVEKDCTSICETGLAALSVAIFGGTSPYIVSGTITDTLETAGVIFAFIEDGEPYEINVVDGDNNQFSQTGGSIPCNFNCCEEIEVESTDGIVECLCDGSAILTLENILNIDTISLIEAYWHSDTDGEYLQNGDTIPANSILEPVKILNFL